MTTTLLTGPPRSGTTLLCSLLDAQPDCLALAEPMSRVTYSDPAKALVDIGRFVSDVRQRALTQRQVISKQINGRIVDNFVTANAQSNELRKGGATLGLVEINKTLTPGFQLFVKHPAFFTAMIPHLDHRYPIFAIVRNPLSILASWQTVDMPVQRGRVPAAEKLTPRLAKALDEEPDRICRQVVLLRWFFHVYRELPSSRVIRFEDLAADPAGILAQRFDLNDPVMRELRPEPIEQRYPCVDLALLAAHLKPSAPEFAYLYPQLEAELSRYG